MTKGGKKGSSSKTNGKSTVKDDFRILKTMLRKTLTELSLDLRTNDESNVSNLIKDNLDIKSDTELLDAIQDTNSELFKSIPTDILAKDPAGQKYLQILSIVQPAFRVKKQKKVKEQFQPLDAPNEEKLSKDKLENMSKHLENMLVEDENTNEIVKLTKDIMKDFNLENKNKEDFNMASMMKMMGNIKTYVDEKMTSGELDKEKLATQTMHMLGKLKQSKEFDEISKSLPGVSPEMLNNPALANLMNNPETLTGMANMMSGEGGLDMGNLMNMMGPLKDVLGGPSTEEAHEADKLADDLLARFDVD